jgi:hypothetical protein
MTGAKFGTLCPMYVANILVLSTSNPLYGPGMEGMLICSFLTTSLDSFAATVEFYSTFIKQMKAENPQLNVSEVSFARGKVGKNSYGKRHSTGISNVSNAAVDDRFFEKH